MIFINWKFIVCLFDIKGIENVLLNLKLIKTKLFRRFQKQLKLFETGQLKLPVY